MVAKYSRKFVTNSLFIGLDVAKMIEIEGGANTSRMTSPRIRKMASDVLFTFCLLLSNLFEQLGNRLYYFMTLASCVDKIK